MLQIIRDAIAAANKKIRANRPDLYSYNPQKLSSWDAYEWYRRFPEFNKIYVDSIVEKYKVMRHVSPRVFPSEVLRSKAPNQSPEEWAYQCALYKPTTISVWNKALNKTKIIANKQNYSIEWRAETDEQKAYFYTDFPIYSDLIAWVFEVLAPEKINFPNRVCVVEPIVPVLDDGTPDQTELAKPIPVILDEEDIVHFEYGNRLIWVVDWTVGKMKFKAVDRQNFYLFEQDGETVTETITYVHGWDFLPAFKLRGKAENVDGEILYSSYFADAIPVLDEAIQVRSNLMMSHFKLAYPIIIEVVDDCEECRGSGTIYNSETEKYDTCGACNGTGRKGWHSPTGTYQVRATSGIGKDNPLPLTPPVQFAAPSSDILRYGKDFLDSLESKAFDFLFKSKEADAATATEVAKNQSEFYSFLIDFSNSVFDDLNYLIEAIGFMRYGEAFSSPTIRRPTEFSFKTNQEITEELKAAKESNMPAVVLEALYEEYGNTRFNTSHMTEQFNFMVALDKFWYLSFEQIKMMEGNISAEDLALHYGYTTIIANLERDNPDFWQLPFEQREQLVREKAAEAAAQIVQNRSEVNVASLFDFTGN